MFQTRSSILRAALMTATVSVLPSPAANLYWDTNGGTAGSGSSSAAWDSGFNWSTDATGSIPQVAWTDGSTAVFSAGTDGLNLTATVGGTVTTPSIVIEEAGNTLTLAGGTIMIGGGTIDSSALGTATDRNVVISAELAGSGGLTIASHGDVGTGNSEIDLTGTNSFEGTLTISSGIVSWDDDLAFGAAANTITLNGGGLLDPNRNLSLVRDVTVGAAGGILRTYGNANTLLLGNLLGSGTLTKSDGGGATFGRDYDFTGTLNVVGGSARIGSAEAGSLANAAAITVGGSGAIWVQRTDAVNTSAILPATINLSAPGSRVEFNPPSQSTVITLNQDLGSSTANGVLRVSGGSLSLATGTDVTVNNVLLGLQSATNRGILNIGPGSTITTPFFDLGQTGNGSGTVNQTGGTATVASGGNGFRLGHWNNGTNPGTVYNLSGGVLDATALSANAGNARLVNVGWDGKADMIVGGGAGSATLKAFGIQIDSNGDTATISDSLTLSLNGRIELGGGNLGSGSANDRLFMNGGTLAATASTVISAASTVNPSTTTTLDANGSILGLTGEIAGTGTLNLIDTVGTGAIDINTGAVTRTIAANLSGNAVLTKGGSGTLVLSANNSHTGDFFVSGGAVEVTGSINSALVDINGGTISGEGSLGGTLGMGFSSPGTLRINPLTPGALAVGGDVELTGVNTLALTTPFAGTTSVLSYGGALTGTGSLALANQANYRSVAISTATPGSISLTIDNEDLTWTPAAGGIWDLNSTLGWTNGGANTFHWGDSVLFNESASIKDVVLAGELAPFGITVDSTSNYTITGGTGNFISGIGGLLKKGSSILSMNGPNTYTGGAVISNGTIQVRSAGALGTGAVVLGDAGTGANPVALYLDTNRVNFGTQVRVSANGTGTATLGSNATVGGSGDNNQFTNIVLERDVVFDSNGGDRTDYENITGTGNITVNGSGRTVFPTTGANWNGDVTVNSTGGLQVGVASTGGNRIPDSSDLTINSGGIVRLSTTSETIAGLNGAGTLGTNSPSGGTATLSLGFGDGNGNFTGLLQAGGGTLAITKIGTGTQTITGTNTHIGRTTITAGTLAIDGEAALGAAPAAVVADQLAFNGGTLRAIGSFALDDVNRGITTTAPGATFEVASGETLTVSSPMAGAGGINKTGPGAMVSSGGTWTGVSTVSGGKLTMLSKSGVSDFVVGPNGILEMGYSTGQNYNSGAVVQGAGTSSPSGLYLLGGTSANFQRNGGLRLSTAPTTIRTYGGGVSTLQGFDINTIHLTVDTEASGSATANDVSVDTGSFGYRMVVAAGAATATGDMVFNGNMTGGGSVPRAGFEVNIMKYGAGSMLLNGVGTFPEGIWIREGSVILGGNDRFSSTAGVAFGDGTVSGTLVLNGYSQTVSDLGQHAGNTDSRVIGGAAGMAALTVNYNGGTPRVFLGEVGGAGNDGNLAIVKGGTGTLVLGGPLAYQGNTTVTGGVLTLGEANLADNSTVSIDLTGNLELAHGENDTVGSLFFNGVAQAVGTWGASGSGATNIDDMRFSGSGMLTVTSTGTPYQSWESANGIAGAGGEADSDGDGIPNGIEFVLGGDPSGPDSNSNSLLPTITTDATYLNFTFRRTDESVGFNPVVQYGTGLTTWADAVNGQPGVTPVVIVTDDDFYAAGIDRVTVRVPKALAAPGAKLFGRLVVDIP
jgi:fibronectin-binding autotransporter adhesin